MQRDGQTSTTKIVAIDYGTNEITIDQSISWKQADAVALPDQGSAPDFGALEYGASSSPASAPVAPANLRVVTKQS
jgi:hypothetical protein